MEPAENSSGLSRDRDDWCVSSVEEVTSMCVWKVNVGIVGSGPPEMFRSPTFWHSESTEWSLEIIRDPQMFYLRLHFLCSKRNLPVKALVRVKVIGISVFNNELLKSFDEIRYVDLTKPQIFDFSFSLCKGEYLNLGSVTMVHCAVTIPTELPKPPVAEAGDRVAGVSLLLPGERGSLAGDLGSLLNSTELSDVVLFAGSTEFRSHRLLLSARSPVFAAMFHHDTREARTGEVHVEDVGPDVLQEVLRYIYTGGTSRLEEMAGQLLVAADKYQLGQLKELCGQQLAANLTSENAAAAGVIALRHSCRALGSSVIAFIKKNLIAVLASDGWTDAIRKHPEIVIQINRLIADKCTDSKHEKLQD